MTTRTWPWMKSIRRGRERVPDREWPGPSENQASLTAAEVPNKENWRPSLSHDLRNEAPCYDFLSPLSLPKTQKGKNRHGVSALWYRSHMHNPILKLSRGDCLNKKHILVTTRFSKFTIAKFSQGAFQYTFVLQRRRSLYHMHICISVGIMTTNFSSDIYIAWPSTESWLEKAKGFLIATKSGNKTKKGERERERARERDASMFF